MRGFAAFIAYLFSIVIISAVLIAAMAGLISPVDEAGGHVPAAVVQKASPAAKASQWRQAAPRIAKSQMPKRNVAADRQQNATTNRALSWPHTANYWDWRKNGT
jgi:hypothetical protein